MKNLDADRTETASRAAGRESFSVPLTESHSRTIEELPTEKKAELIRERSNVYPLRGRSYRYERPHEAVALNDWGDNIQRHGGDA